jgi:uncharacterized protein
LADRFVLDGPAKATDLIVLAHGAGSGMRNDFMDHFASGLASAGHRVARFEFPYMTAGKKAPDKGPVLEGSFLDTLEALDKERKGRKVVAGGKSMGGRIASQAAAAGMPVDGLIFLGYPLHPPGRPDRIRDAHLRDIEVPMLFVEGTRDPFCPLETLDRVLKPLKKTASVFVVEDGDHSLKVRKSSGRSTIEAWNEAISAIDAWLTKI